MLVSILFKSVWPSIFLKYSVIKLHKITSFVLSGSQTLSLALRKYTERVSVQIPKGNISTSNRGSNQGQEKLQSAQPRIVTLKY